MALPGRALLPLVAPLGILGGGGRWDEGREGEHDPAILRAFARLRGSAAAGRHVQEIPLRSLRVGMVLAEDMRTKAGLLRSRAASR